MSGFKLTGANGDEITFDREEFVLNEGLLGLGIPPTVVRIDESSRDGGTFRFSRRGIREVDLPITVLGDTALAVEASLRRLAKITQDGQGPTVLTALRDAGNLTLELHYTGGAELNFGGTSGGKQFAKAVLSFQAANPYWQSADTESFTVTVGNTGRGLLPNLTKLQVSSSQAIGLINVTNTSDVPIYPTFVVTGPVDGLQVTLNNEGWSFTENLTSGEQFTVNHADGTVVNTAGANRYDILDTSPKFFALPPGTSSILVVGTSATVDTQIEASYNLAFEVVHG